MNRNPPQISVKAAIKAKLVSFLYDIPTDYYDQKLNKIILENEIKQHVSLLGVRYKHNQFTRKLNLASSYRYTIKQADPSTETALDQYIEDTDQLYQEKQVISIFLSTLLNFVRDQEDFRYLVGNNLYQEGGGDTLLLKSARKYNDKEAFKKQYQDHFDTINQRILENILMQDIYNDN